MCPWHTDAHADAKLVYSHKAKLTYFNDQRTINHEGNTILTIIELAEDIIILNHVSKVNKVVIKIT